MRRRRGALEPHHLREKRLKAGDTLLLAGPWRAIRRLQKGGQDLVLLNLPKEFDEYLPAAKRAPYAVLTLLVVVVLMATGVVPNVQAALIGCLMMGLFGCIDLDGAYRSIQMKSLIMIVGMMPFALALDRTGGVDMAADFLVGILGNSSAHLILAVLFAITVLLCLFIVNTANAVLLIPLGLAIAEELAPSPYPFAMIIALGASSAFMTPVSPVNTLVTTAGSYRLADFIRIGLPLTLIVGAISVALVPWLLPLYPSTRRLLVPVDGDLRLAQLNQHQPKKAWKNEPMADAVPAARRVLCDRLRRSGSQRRQARSAKRGGGRRVGGSAQHIRGGRNRLGPFLASPRPGLGCTSMDLLQPGETAEAGDSGLILNRCMSH